MKRREAIASTIAGVALPSGGSAAYAQGWRAWQPAVIAVEVRKGDRTLTLRDASGIPVWAGWRR